MAKGNRTEKRGHRSRIEIDFKELEKLCQFQCTEEEIAEWFNCSIKTVTKRIKERYGLSFSLFFTRHRVSGLISLRRNMFRMSAKYPRMAIFLATNYLKMSERREIANPPEESFRVHDTTDAKGKLISALNRLASRVREEDDTKEPE